MKKTKTKRGITSMFVTSLVIVVLGVITLGFTHIVITEATQTTNYDLSQSAYDSALAGIEDGKIALLSYHKCLDSGATISQGSTCSNIIRAMQDGIANQDCDTVKNVLTGNDPGSDNGRTSDPEQGVVVQEVSGSYGSGTAGNSENMTQSYTCVTIEEDLPDYRTTLNKVSKSRVIPIRSNDSSVDSNNAIKNITIKWYSTADAARTDGTGGISNLTASDQFPSGNSMRPPVLALDLFQTNEAFNLNELTTSNTDHNTDRGHLYLRPVSSGGSDKVTAADWAYSSDKALNLPKTINCDQYDSDGDGFICSATLELPDPYRDGSRNSGSTFLLVNLPYGQPQTDMSVTMKKQDNNAARFVGVQARIDSTGRANELYRRVETRVELVDTFFPYPEHAITMNDDDNNVIKKSFFVTYNCWYADGGSPMMCANNGEI